MRRPATLPDGLKQRAYLHFRQPGQFPLLELQQLHALQRVRVVDIPQLVQLVVYRPQVSKAIVQRLPIRPLGQLL
ncbi:hypothetical protein D9M71_607100 [compost metagenome]